MGRLPLVVGVVALIGCSAGTDGGPAYELDERGCVVGDPEAVFATQLSPCVDAGCAAVDAGIWFPDLGEDDESVVETVREARCTLGPATSGDGDSRVWRLSECTGDAAPASRSLLLELEAEPLPTLEAGTDVVVGVHWRRSAYGHSDHRSWTLRDDDGALMVLASDQDGLPVESFSEPFVFSAEPQACVEPLDGSPVVGPMEVTVEVGARSLVLPSGHRARVGSDDGFMVTVDLAAYAANQQGIIGGYRRFNILAVATED